MIKATALALLVAAPTFTLKSVDKPGESASLDSLGAGPALLAFYSPYRHEPAMILYSNLDGFQDRGVPSAAISQMDADFMAGSIETAREQGERVTFRVLQDDTPGDWGLFGAYCKARSLDPAEAGLPYFFVVKEGRIVFDSWDIEAVAKHLGLLK